MRRKLRLIDRILLVLASMGDLIEEIHDPAGWMANYYKNLYGWIPSRYKRSNFRKTVEEMFKAGFIEKVVKDGQLFLRITSPGRKTLTRDFPIFAFRNKKWDGLCTLIPFDIEEINKKIRDKFRIWLYSIGAGKMQQSAYLLPYNLAIEIKEVAKNFGLTKQVKIFLTNLDFIDDKKAFARKVWNLERVEERYQEVLSILEFVEGEPTEDKEKLIQKAKVKFVETLILDPILPKELLPNEWIGDEVRTLFKNLS